MSTFDRYARRHMTPSPATTSLLLTKLVVGALIMVVVVGVCCSCGGGGGVSSLDPNNMLLLSNYAQFLCLVSRDYDSLEFKHPHSPFLKLYQVFLKLEFEVCTGVPSLQFLVSLPDTYFGPGTVENIKCHMNAIESMNGELDGIFVNAILSAVQQRNLERAWEVPVLDRVGLIIEIFHAHAYTKEARLQAELAALMYKKSRLVRVRGTSGSYTFGAKGEAKLLVLEG